jgi:hypothetical protein
MRKRHPLMLEKLDVHILGDEIGPFPIPIHKKIDSRLNYKDKNVISS